MVAVAVAFALLSCRPPPVKDSKKNTELDPDFDSEFRDGEEFSSTTGSPSYGGDEESSAPYEACAAKKCGEPCTSCDIEDEACVELQVIKECNLARQCVVAPVDCTPPEEDEKDKDKKKKKKK